jgi:hypothetical protein
VNTNSSKDQVLRSTTVDLAISVGIACGTRMASVWKGTQELAATVAWECNRQRGDSGRLRAPVVPDAFISIGQKGSRLPRARWTQDNQELAAASDVIVISVRPEQFPGIRIDARGKLVILVIAGVPARVLAERVDSDRYVRAMPNAAASIRRSYAPWFASEQVSQTEKRWVQALFETCGSAD